MDNLMTEWILMKLYRHDPCVPAMIFLPKQNSKNITPERGRRNLNFHYKNVLKNRASVVKAHFSQAENQ